MKTELVLARIFRAAEISGWRRRTAHVSMPDLVFRERRVVVFVDGCFWHGCPKHFNMPANNRAFWMKKLSGNQSRDRLVTRTLRKDGTPPTTCIHLRSSAVLRGSQLGPRNVN